MNNEPQKLMCIYDEWEHEQWWGRLLDKIFGKGKDPTYGEIVTVKSETEGYYILNEYPNENYRKDGFVPINHQYKAISFEKIMEKEKTISAN